VAGAAPAEVAALTPEELAPVVREAKAERRSLGLDAAEQAALDRVGVYLTSLPAPYLGLAALGATWINVTAAVLPWFLDPSPAADALFAAGLVRGQVDLLTVVAHVLGHVLGLAYEGATASWPGRWPPASAVIRRPRTCSARTTSSARVRWWGAPCRLRPCSM
jgi:hypothetical protein